jgi:DDE family transposase
MIGTSHTQSVFRYRIRNWHQYNRALINRGRLTVWFDEQAVAAWRNREPAIGPGAPRLYADLAIDCALVFKAVYHLSLRAAQGFLSSVVDLMKLTLPVPDYSTVSRRQGTLQVRLPVESGGSPRHVVGSVRNHPNLSLRGRGNRRLHRGGEDDAVSTL